MHFCINPVEKLATWKRELNLHACDSKFRFYCLDFKASSASAYTRIYKSRKKASQQPNYFCVLIFDQTIRYLAAQNIPECIKINGREAQAICTAILFSASVRNTIGVARGGGQGARVFPIEMLLMIKMSKNKTIVSSVSLSFSIFAYNGTRVQQ